MLTTVITALIYLCIFAIVVYLVIYVLGVIGVPIPPKVIQLVWVIVALIAILWLVNMVVGGGGLKLGKLTGLVGTAEARPRVTVTAPTDRTNAEIICPWVTGSVAYDWPQARQKMMLGQCP